ncbi:MAG: hypothetical protein AAGH74_09940 [Pseudomonadota bacterium]
MGDEIHYSHATNLEQTKEDGPDHRLVELVRVLARDAAEEHHRRELTATNTPTNREEQDPP